MIALMCSLYLNGVKGSAQIMEPRSELAIEKSVSVLVADVIVVKTRYYNGKLQYRRWNETKGIWVDSSWIDAD